MFKMMAVAATGLMLVGPSVAEAGAIKRACQKSDRPAASVSLCGCIQKVADRQLSAREQRKVAKWFDDPHQAQVTRQSNHWADEELWLRYKKFGQVASKSCR